MLKKNARECMNGNHRKVYYEVDKIGSNVRYVQKDNVCVLNPSTTLRNTIFIVKPLADLSEIKKIQFYTQLRHMIQKNNLNTHRDQCYVILSIMKINKNVQKMNQLIFENDIPLMKGFNHNQIALTKGNCHFNTTGSIHVLGYGPKSNQNKFGHFVVNLLPVSNISCLIKIGLFYL